VQETSKKGSLGCNLIKLDNPANFEHEIDFQASPNLEKGVTSTKEGTVKYNARVSALPPQLCAWCLQICASQSALRKFWRRSNQCWLKKELLHLLPANCCQFIHIVHGCTLSSLLHGSLGRHSRGICLAGASQTPPICPGPLP